MAGGLGLSCIADVVITTAQVFGRKPPVLVTKDMIDEAAIARGQAQGLPQLEGPVRDHLGPGR